MSYNYFEHLNFDIKKMNKDEKQMLIDWIGEHLKKLAEDVDQNHYSTFLLDKWNNVYIGDDKYNLKLTKAE